MSIEIKLEMDNRLKQFIAKNTPKQVSLAVARALDRTMVTVRKEASQKIKKLIRLPAAKIKSSLKIKKAYGPTRLLDDQTAYLLASTEGISLSYFSPSQARPGVRVNITGKRQLIRHAFLATMKNGQPLVFRRVRTEKPMVASRRVGKNRSELPIRKQATQGINRLIPDIAPGLAKTAMAVFYPRFNHELARRLKG